MTHKVEIDGVVYLPRYDVTMPDGRTLPVWRLMKMARKLKGWTQAEAAKMAGVSPTTVFNAECGTVGLKQTHQLARAYDIDPATLAASILR